jgi:hypothetical protein
MRLKPRQTEVGEPRAAGACLQEDVRRFYIAMDQTAGMRRRQPIRGLSDDACGFARVQALSDTTEPNYGEAVLQWINSDTIEATTRLGPVPRRFKWNRIH